MTDVIRGCNTCRWAVFEDTGYSNWTVEGTTFSCAVKMHPDAPFDRFYGTDLRLAYGDKCSVYSVGQPVHCDVEFQSDNNDLTEEQQISLNLLNCYR